MDVELEWLIGICTLVIIGGAGLMAWFAVQHPLATLGALGTLLAILIVPVVVGRAAITFLEGGA